MCDTGFSICYGALSRFMRKILIYRLGSLGDTIVALPCFHKIARSFPDTERIVVTNLPVESHAPRLEDVLGRSGLIHGAIAYPIRLRNPHLIRKLAATIREKQAVTMIYLTRRESFLPVLRDLLFFRAIGLKEIIGAPIAVSKRKYRIDPKTGVEEPEAERLTRQLAALGPIDLNDKASWDLRLQDDEIASALEAAKPLLDAPFVAIHPGGKGSSKFWGEANWMWVLDRLSRCCPGAGLAVMGSAAEAQQFGHIARAWTGTVLNLCGRLTVRQSAAVMERAVLFVGHDSGPMHLAASRGTRCVAIFGSQEPAKRWHPYGAGHLVFHDMRGVSFIKPKDVLLGIKTILNV
jgi:heptosyltransferase III